MMFNQKEYQKEYRRKNREALAVKAAERRARPEAKTKAREVTKAHYAKNKEKALAYAKQYRKTNAQTIAQQNQVRSKKYRAENVALERERHRKYRDNNVDSIRVGNKKYREENPHINAAKTARYRAGLKQATPVWSERIGIQTLYAKRIELERLWDVELHVDHIVPLNHDTVCGLHCLANLQIISAEDNLSKSNRFGEMS